jgi:sortase A
MRKSIFLFLIFFLILPSFIIPSETSAASTPFTTLSPAVLAQPSRLTIPTIKLTASIKPVGTDSQGAMAVPVIPNTVGWYKNGTVPGALGSAVLDAHVYLAFKNLKKIKTGDSIYVETQNGSKLRFIVSRIASYLYTNVPMTTLFSLNDDKHLNLITCAGAWLADQGTYDHRLAVYTTLAG